MKKFRNVITSYGLFFGLFLLTGLSQIVKAAPRVATNPSGKSLDQVGDSFFSWFLDDIRPWIIVFLVVGGIFGGWLGGRMRWVIAGTCTGLTLFLMALPTIISKVYQWM